MAYPVQGQNPYYPQQQAPPQTVITTTVLSQSNFSAGMCDCCIEDFGGCIYAWCFTPMLYFRAQSLYDGGDPFWYLMGGTACLSYSVIRQGYGITGGCCQDLCYPLWCYPCAALQLYHEVKIRGPRPKILTR